MLAVSSDKGWTLFDLSREGKRRRVYDIIVPSFITDSELENYLADLYHEAATAEHPDVRRLNP